MKVPYEIEEKINNIPGVVANGIFSSRRADLLIVDKNGEPTILK
jgi:ribose 5-phosphate isomerase